MPRLAILEFQLLVHRPQVVLLVLALVLVLVERLLHPASKQYSEVRDYRSWNMRSHILWHIADRAYRPNQYLRLRD